MCCAAEVDLRRDKHRELPSSLAILSNHPSVAPHVHSLLVVHPMLVDRFLEIVPSLESVWQRIPVRTTGLSTFCAPTYANRTLHADVQFALTIRELMDSDPLGNRSLVRERIRRVVAYSAKLNAVIGKMNRDRPRRQILGVLGRAGLSARLRSSCPPSMRC
jgi:hypothetical protein